MPHLRHRKIVNQLLPSTVASKSTWLPGESQRRLYVTATDVSNYPPKPSWQHGIRRLQGLNSDWQADLTSRARVGAAGRRLSCQTGR